MSKDWGLGAMENAVVGDWVCGEDLNIDLSRKKPRTRARVT